MNLILFFPVRLVLKREKSHLSDYVEKKNNNKQTNNKKQQQKNKQKQKTKQTKTKTLASIRAFTGRFVSNLERW